MIIHIWPLIRRPGFTVTTGDRVKIVRTLPAAVQVAESWAAAARRRGIIASIEKPALA